MQLALVHLKITIVRVEGNKPMQAQELDCPTFLKYTENNINIWKNLSVYEGRLSTVVSLLKDAFSKLVKESRGN